MGLFPEVRTLLSNASWICSKTILDAFYLNTDVATSLLRWWAAVARHMTLLDASATTSHESEAELCNGLDWRDLYVSWLRNIVRMRSCTAWGGVVGLLQNSWFLKLDAIEASWSTILLSKIDPNYNEWKMIRCLNNVLFFIVATIYSKRQSLSHLRKGGVE